MVKEISIAKLKKELLLAKETIAAKEQERELLEEKLIVMEEVSFTYFHHPSFFNFTMC
jgi:hypothetical protein